VAKANRIIRGPGSDSIPAWPEAYSSRALEFEALICSGHSRPAVGDVVEGLHAATHALPHLMLDAIRMHDGRGGHEERTQWRPPENDAHWAV
jgi:hypothetical protein